MQDANKVGIKLKEYLRLLPLMRQFPHLSLGDVIELDSKYPNRKVSELIDIVKAKIN